MSASKVGCRYGSKPESFTDVVVDTRSTGFAGVAAADDAASLDAAAEDAASLEALADALEALPDPLEHATMNSANIAAKTVASNSLIVVDFFIVSLPSFYPSETRNGVTLCTVSSRFRLLGHERK